MNTRGLRSALPLTASAVIALMACTTGNDEQVPESAPDQDSDAGKDSGAAGASEGSGGKQQAGSGQGGTGQGGQSLGGSGQGGSGQAGSGQGGSAQAGSGQAGKAGAAGAPCTSNYCQDSGFGSGKYCAQDDSVTCGMSSGCKVELARTTCSLGCDQGACVTDPCAKTPTMSWTTRASLAQPDQVSISTVLNGEIHTFGWSSYLLHRVYSPASNTWTTKNNTPKCASEGVAAVVNGQLWAFNDGTFGSGEAMRWSASSDTWTMLSANPAPRRLSAGGVINGKVYMAGGFAGNDAVVNAYDPSTDSWQALAPLTVLAGGANSSVVLNGKLYVIGVVGGNYNPTLISSYAPGTNAWTTHTPLTSSRYLSKAVLVGSTIWLLGGQENGSPRDSVFIYHASVDTWCPGPSLPAPMSGVAAEMVNGKLYVIGGYVGSNSMPSSQVWEGTVY